MNVQLSREDLSNIVNRLVKCSPKPGAFMRARGDNKETDYVVSSTFCNTSLVDLHRRHSIFPATIKHEHETQDDQRNKPMATFWFKGNPCSWETNQCHVYVAPNSFTMRLKAPLSVLC